MLEMEKVPDLLRLVAGVSTVLGPEWTFNPNVDPGADADAWAEYVGNVSWRPAADNSGHYPIVVDVYSEAAGEGPPKLQMWSEGFRDRMNASVEIRTAIERLTAWAEANQIPYGLRADLTGMENPTTEVFMLVDEAHAHSALEPWLDDDPGIETFRSAEQAKAYASEWVNRRLAEAGQPPIAIEWTQDERGVFPMNLPDDDAVSYFQILRAKSGPEFPAEEYFRQRGR
jgi:hypothetical protein